MWKIQNGHYKSTNRNREVKIRNIQIGTCKPENTTKSNRNIQIENATHNIKIGGYKSEDINETNENHKIQLSKIKLKTTIRETQIEQMKLEHTHRTIHIIKYNSGNTNENQKIHIPTNQIGIMQFGKH